MAFSSQSIVTYSPQQLTMMTTMTVQMVSLMVAPRASKGQRHVEAAPTWAAKLLLKLR
jgi:hypothetical protein